MTSRIAVEILDAPSVLERALALVRGDRRRQYGPPALNHGTTAAMFAAYLERRHGVMIPFDAQDVCVFNVVQKLARDAHAPKQDNLIDIAGYVENLDEIRRRAA